MVARGHSADGPFRDNLGRVTDMDRAVLDADINREVIPHTCGACGRLFNKGWGFGFKAASAVGGDAQALPNDIVKCMFCAVRHAPMLRRSLKVAVVVGTVLNLLHQGDTLFSGAWQNALYWKIPLTYCVPFMVATFGALANIRR